MFFMAAFFWTSMTQGLDAAGIRCDPTFSLCVCWQRPVSVRLCSLWKTIVYIHDIVWPSPDSFVVVCIVCVLLPVPFTFYRDAVYLWRCFGLFDILIVDISVLASLSLSDMDHKEVFAALQTVCSEVILALDGSVSNSSNVDANDRLKGVMKQIQEHGRAVEPLITGFTTVYHHYDLDPQTPGNGYRTLVKVTGLQNWWVHKKGNFLSFKTLLFANEGFDGKWQRSRMLLAVIEWFSHFILFNALLWSVNSCWSLILNYTFKLNYFND